MNTKFGYGVGVVLMLLGLLCIVISYRRSRSVVAPGPKSVMSKFNYGLERKLPSLVCLDNGITFLSFNGIDQSISSEEFRFMKQHGFDPVDPSTGYIKTTWAKTGTMSDAEMKEVTEFLMKEYHIPAQGAK